MGRAADEDSRRSWAVDLRNISKETRRPASVDVGQLDGWSVVPMLQPGNIAAGRASHSIPQADACMPGALNTDRSGEKTLTTWAAYESANRYDDRGRSTTVVFEARSRGRLRQARARAREAPLEPKASEGARRLQSFSAHGGGDHRQTDFSWTELAFSGDGMAQIPLRTAATAIASFHRRRRQARGDG